jgi:multicomponent Na+:H+ antiporter subunit C
LVSARIIEVLGAGILISGTFAIVRDAVPVEILGRAFGLYGLIVQPHPLRKLVAFNIMGTGVFVLFGALAKRGAAAGMAADPVPQALLITAIVVAFAATAVTVALLLRLIESTDSASLANEPPSGD